MIQNFVFTYWKSIFLVLIITFLSVYPFSSGIDLPQFQYQDKLIHSLMYVALGFVIFYDTYQNKKTVEKRRCILVIVLIFPLVFGGLIEIIQAAFFPPRTAEWLDWVADIVGSVGGFMLAILILRNKWKKKIY